ncbi:class I SAM-dependent methyltransferase [Fibrella forsythiae]|uniref:Class I SAM-dependent methyltransferase n=1 Tax=Fibrella forsythiae TaxID=2817061 RepID=A0ABS3JIZ0_9BACT|nr:class I SAM-dependent methyltransferase [Fibrella forsythiae]MBO0949977.1 class I SAM-dependent methyltransferase [Fibrella forsythiae]
MELTLKEIGERLVGMKRGLLLSPPPGHYYSPIVDKVDMRRRADELFAPPARTVAGIDLNEVGQLSLLSEFEAFYPEIPFKTTKQPGYRYYYDNKFYCESDGIFLYSIIRKFQPKRIIEVGSGFSSACMLDTLDSLGRTDVSLTFIEPYPDRLKANMRPADFDRCTIIETGIQAVDAALFSTLQTNDILFIDSTHVSKTGSDVNRVIFEILPSLPSGVLIHFHDIFYPFEYPRDWVLNSKGFGWNEAYILRAFLSHNPDFEIVAFNTFLEEFHAQRFEAHMPLCMENKGGSIWIRRK